MAKLEDASVEQLRRLLDFFPASDLKEEWIGLKGLKKADIVEAISKTQDRQRVSKFIRASFARCRQHVLLLEKPDPLPDMLAAFPPADILGEPHDGSTFYLSSLPYTMYLLDPMEAVPVEVLWPIKITIREKLVVVRFVVLERDPANFTGRTLLKSAREIDEKTIIQNLAKLGFMPHDINKGVKALWDSKYMDAFRSSYKRAKSTATVVMDEGIGLRESEPETYKELTSKPLLNNSFKTDPALEKSLRIFQINASMGRIGFTSYTENPGDADAVIEAILAGNS